MFEQSPHIICKVSAGLLWIFIGLRGRLVKFVFELVSEVFDYEESAFLIQHLEELLLVHLYRELVHIVLALSTLHYLRHGLAGPRRHRRHFCPSLLALIALFRFWRFIALALGRFRAFPFRRLGLATFLLLRSASSLLSLLLLVFLRLRSATLFLLTLR